MVEMQLIRAQTQASGKRPRLRLRKDLVRDVKRGHAWLYNGAVEARDLPSGMLVDLYDKRGEQHIAVGLYDPEHPITLRVLATKPPFKIDDHWLAQQLKRALSLRKDFFSSATTGMRWIAGEGDGLPGLIVDRYGEVAVLKVDGGAVAEFYCPAAIAKWLVENSCVRNVVQRFRERGRAGQLLEGSAEDFQAIAPFLENGLRFKADVLRGQKTGFFLDQRDNRELIRQLSAGKRVLNLYSFSGGFSIAAGVGGAREVVSVDIAAGAIEDACEHWSLNELAAGTHQATVADCFEFLSEATQSKKQWDLVIVDPPSFAPNEKSKSNALAAYQRLARQAAQVTSPQGMLAFASCSSHISESEFQSVAELALGKERRKATLLTKRGLPMDHPTPLAMPELRYLKFFLFRLD